MLNSKRKWTCGRSGCKKQLWSKPQESQHLRSSHSRNPDMQPVTPLAKRFAA
jgi:hypothetical protein